MSLYVSAPANTSILATVPGTDPSAITSTTGVMAGLSAGPGSTTCNATSLAAQRVLLVTATTNFVVGTAVAINATKSTCEIGVIASIQAGVSLAMVNPLLYPHYATETVVGSYAAITPKTSGKVRVTIAGYLTAGATADTDTAQISYGSLKAAAAPANGAAVTGTLSGNVFQFVSLTGVLSQTLLCIAIMTLTVGTPYWIDLNLTGSASTTQAQKLICITEEL